MEQVIKLIQANGIWVFLTGLITSILLGVIKTIVRKFFITAKLDEKKKEKREVIFDTVTFLSTFILAFGGALALYPILNKGFDFAKAAALTLPVWLSQSVSYGVWKKGSLKKGLQILWNFFVKLIIKDKNGDGKVSLDEAIEQVKDAYKDGKLDPEKLMADMANNANENFGSAVEGLVNDTDATEITKEQEAVVEAIEGDTSKLTETIKDTAKDLVEEVKGNQEQSGDSDVVVAHGQAIDL